ncbi:MAG: Holliday junction branch migration DNA helicase RuvB [Planctomycetes bacterium]|nr:Holliday junction branch migration DNA helicase RuvB [Planctomycetota bacterium]
MPAVSRLLSRAGDAEDWKLDVALRPGSFGEFVGQARVVQNLSVYIAAARQRGEAMDHLLLSGLPGLGKTTLAQLVARELGVGFKATSGPVIERPADLAGLLTNLQPRDVLFIDEIHRVPVTVEEYLYSAMEDYILNILIDQGPQARSIKVDLPPFTLVGATTREGLLTSPFRSRFGVVERLEPYPWEDLSAIVRRSAKILETKIEEPAAECIARRSRGTPRLANRFLRRIRDVAQVRRAASITSEIADEGLGMLGVDGHGLDAMDRKILETLVRQGGKPVGLKTVAVTVGEEEETIEEVYEPYLIQNGWLLKTPKGRRPTEAAFTLLGQRPPLMGPPSGDLFEPGG